MIKVEKNEMDIHDNFSKATYISYIDLMLGLTQKEIERLENKNLEEVRHEYNMAFLQNSDELLT